MTVPKFPIQTSLGGGSLSPVVFDNTPWVRSNCIYAGANFLGFVISLLTGSHVHLDLIGSGAFCAAAIPTLLDPPGNDRIRYSSSAVALWGSKLALFLFYRALQTGHDIRLEDTLSTFSGTCT